MVSHKEPFQRLVSQGMILGELEYMAMQQPDGSFAQDSQAQGTAVRCVCVCVCALVLWLWSRPHL